ncbi:MAG: 3-oxoacyl-[acyl-carrier-protein] reductase [Elusimicrobia bacterium]|nr:3-oxoacyl-[acyl-carrier-protein] reductase [Elusimicrobiota bacterium]
MRLQDKAAIITGGAQGIGKATARLFLTEGAKLMLADMDAAALATTARELDPSGKSVTTALCNVTKFAECDGVVKKAMEFFGRLDILINNAGITKDNLMLRMTEAEWDAVIDVNLKGVFNMAKACTPIMVRQRSGRMVNISSVVGQMGNAGQVNYAASKGGVLALTKSLARELASRQILCNAVAPGFIRTRLTDVLPEDVKKQYLSGIALKRFGEPEEIAKVCLFLSSDDSSYVTGQVIGVNGGLYT